MKFSRLASALALLLVHGAQAELTVVEDLGADSALAYYRSLNPAPPTPSAQAMPLPPVRLKAYGETDMLPVRSESLSPGHITPRVHHVPGLQPVFLIGDDDLSRRWLQQRAALLRDLGAVGLVVDVQRLQALAELRQLGTGLNMLPAAADDLARRLGLAHYPVLVTATGIEQ
ncbi:integrating conjugative element protein [Pseudomonas gingeri]|uniref:Integrating conjugative element protein n=1 Tax=Pseudomonas gingeri TaxID=117681 RepID=A0A7Y7YCN0_9PSED|nr:integrating conjugative element protein [Pseudomonas gingeri]NWA02317.1 integrating conjugative element protein [Pseudomonas gingeri]NWA12510.1 integrating conjugative element protein [Pseudomonas gingeri]NWA57084.1 integrating conjugative element protein [Pseudomonas gingeri]NWA93427.1 integrating conjugative element protein [Pseudomonas gingeri]NWB02899.1 integrating conjugative element protein [Pseudomonas gingeri]